MTFAKRRAPNAKRPANGFTAFVAELRAQVAATGGSWRFEKYVDDPVGFAREVLGVKVWSKQVEILLAARDHKRVSVTSGHKVSKSHTAAILALWWYCTRDDARVQMTSTTARQVDEILWLELRKMKQRAKEPIPGHMYDLARSGLKSEDFREIVGFTAKEAEGAAGISGANLLYICDEASGIPDSIFEAIEGNRAGGARIILFSNPTRTDGEFFESHHSKAEFYKCIEVSSEDTPNVVEGREIIPGLATREWVEEKKKEWGTDSALYKIRVQGKFVLSEDGKIISVHAITQAEERWHETEAKGVLSIGLDPAGEGGDGDESVWAPRRGLKVIELVDRRGLTEDGHVAMTVGLIKEHRKSKAEEVRVIVDRDGPVGAKVYGALLVYLQKPDHEREVSFRLIGIRSGEWATRKPKEFERVRDEMWMNAADWIRGGGAIPEDTKLSKDLHAPAWIPQINGKTKATPKKVLRKLLGRSPDRGDSVVLSCWEPDSAVERIIEEQRRAQQSQPQTEQRVPRMDPYATGGGHGGGPGMDPYRGM